MGHAITPSASRPLPTPQRPREANVQAALDGALSHSAELVDLTEELAAEAARTDIECCCRPVTSDGRDWYDPRTATGEDVEVVERAMRYFELRLDTTPQYRVVRSHAFPSLFRFEDIG